MRSARFNQEMRRLGVSADSNAAVMKIAILADGRITVDGEPATTDSLRVSLKRLAEQHRVVWYYREAAEAEPPAEAMHVLKAGVENRLPIRLSSRADFSDAIGADGRPLSRGPQSN